MYPSDIVNDISTRDALLALRATDVDRDDDDDEEEEEDTTGQRKPPPPLTSEERAQLLAQLAPHGDLVDMSIMKKAMCHERMGSMRVIFAT
jgi:hypothetical protein